MDVSGSAEAIKLMWLRRVAIRLRRATAAGDAERSRYEPLGPIHQGWAIRLNRAPTRRSL